MIMKHFLFATVALLLQTMPSAYGQDTTLLNIQEKIYVAFLSDINARNETALPNIVKTIERVGSTSQLSAYWRAYAQYYSSLYHMKTADRRRASKVLDAAIADLEDVANKNSETYALLAYLRSFSIQFLAGPKSASVSRKARADAEAALKLDSTNLRAWYVLASNDYYTPPAFGGGKRCEEYLKKAVSLDEQTVANPYMPSWGKASAFAMLIDFYIKKEDYEKAKQVLNEAQRQYPSDYMIGQYAEKLKDA